MVDQRRNKYIREKHTHLIGHAGADECVDVSEQTGVILSVQVCQRAFLSDGGVGVQLGHQGSAEGRTRLIPPQLQSVQSVLPTHTQCKKHIIIKHSRSVVVN